MTARSHGVGRRRRKMFRGMIFNGRVRGFFLNVIGFFIAADVLLFSIGGGDVTYAMDGGPSGPVCIGGNDSAQALAIQSDVKLVAAGYANDQLALARYITDGSLDATFGNKGIVTSGSMFGGLVYGIAIQSDDKIVVAGNDSLVRYNTNGSLDTTFGNGGSVSFMYGNAMVLQTDDKVVAIAGPALFRYNTNGSLDTSFGTSGKAAADIVPTSLIIQSDGKLVAAGYSDKGADTDFAVTRFNVDGSLDITFGNGGIAITSISSGIDIISALALQDDGKLVAAGPSNSQLALVRYNADGSLDATFGSEGIVTNGSVLGGWVPGLIIQSDGQIVAASGSVLVRYNTNGTLDTTFENTGIRVTPLNNSNALALQENGRLVAAGYVSNSTDTDFALVRYKQDGSLDQTFGRDGIVITPITKAVCSGGSSNTETSGNSGGGGGSCFIATAAYGSYLDPHVQLLRDFRDRRLMPHSLGRMFVNLYYRYSPPAAAFIARHDGLRMAARIALTPIVYMVKYPMTAALLFMVGLGWVGYVCTRNILGLASARLQKPTGNKSNESYMQRGAKMKKMLLVVALIGFMISGMTSPVLAKPGFYLGFGIPYNTIGGDFDAGCGVSLLKGV